MPQRSRFLLAGAALLALNLCSYAQQPARGSSAPVQSTQHQERDPVPSPDDISPGVLAPAPTANTAGPAAANPPAPTGNAPTTAASGTTTPRPAPGTPASTAANVPAGPDVTPKPGSNTVAVQNQPQQGQAPRQSGNGYTFTAEVNEVRLYATVVDQKQRLVTNLQRNDFQVFEDGQPQQITQFAQEDVPVALGILIDNSGSMRDKRDRVNDAAINLVKSSNPQDQVFIVNFNDEPYLDQDFTPDVKQLQDGLEHVDSRGGTALYDAVVGASKHMIESDGFLKKKGIIKRVLLVITDGEDNASRDSLEEAIRYVQGENGPTVYTIGLLGDEHARRARRALEALAVETGGVSFFPRNIDEVDAISKAVAHDIRNQYIIRYRSTKPQSEGGYRQVRVEARAPGYRDLHVRTRTGYYAGSQQSADAQPQQRGAQQVARQR